MTILENFIEGGWQKKAPADEGTGAYTFSDKVKNNIVNNQESINNFDVLQKYKSGEYLHRVGALEFAPANDVLMATSLEPVPQSLWGDGLIIENEINLEDATPTKTARISSFPPILCGAMLVNIHLTTKIPL